MKHDFDHKIGMWLIAFGILAVLSAPAIWAYQMFEWLRWGHGTRILVSHALQWMGSREPQFTWAGVQKISDFVMARPLSVFMIFAGIALMFLGTQCGGSDKKGVNAQYSVAANIGSRSA